MSEIDESKELQAFDAAESSWTGWFRKVLQPLLRSHPTTSSLPATGNQQNVPDDMENDLTVSIPSAPLALSPHDSIVTTNELSEGYRDALNSELLDSCVVEKYQLMTAERIHSEKQAAISNSLSESISCPSSQSWPASFHPQVYHQGNIIVNYPLDQELERDRQCKSKLVYEMGLKLKNKYKRLTIPWTPWMKDVKFSLEKYYVDLRMHPKDNIGKVSSDKIAISEFFEGTETVYRVIVEGNPGYGKTVLSCKLAYDWAKGESYLAQFKIVILLQLRYLDCEIHEAIYEEVRLSEYYQEAIMETLDFFSDDMLLILDGYDELPDSKRHEIFNVFSQTKYASATVVMTTRPHLHDIANLREMCGKRIVIVGMNDEQQREFIRQADLDRTKVQKILTIVSAPDTKELFQCPLLFILLCFLTVDSEVLATDKVSTLFKEMFNYMVRNSVYREEDQNVDLFNQSWTSRHPKQFVSLLVDFGKLSLDCVLKNKLTFVNSEISSACGDLEITKLGFLNRTAKMHHWRTVEYYEPVHKTFLEFLAAYYIEHQLHVDLKQCQKLCRAVLREGNSSSPIITFLVGLLQDDAVVLLKTLPIHYFLSFSEAVIPDVIEESSDKQEILQSFSGHVTRKLHLKCTAYVKKVPFILINPWDYINNVRLLQYHKNLRVRFPTNSYLSVRLNFEVLNDEITALSEVKPDDVDMMPLAMQFAARSLVEHYGDRVLSKLREFSCEILEMASIQYADRLSKYLHLELGMVITNMCPKQLKLFGFTWEKEGTETVFKYLVEHNFNLEKLILEDHVIDSTELAEIIGTAVVKMHVTHFSLEFDMLITNSEHWLPLYEKMLDVSMSRLESLTIKINSEGTEISQEFVDALVALVGHLPGLDEFSFLACSQWYHRPILTFNLCQMTGHGTKKYKQLHFEKAVVSATCTDHDNPDSNLQFSPVSFSVASLEIISRYSHFAPEESVKSLLMCSNLVEFTCDALLAKVAFETIPANWTGFKNIRSLVLVLMKEIFSECWLFINQFQNLEHLLIDFRERSEVYLDNISPADWLSILNTQLHVLQSIGIRIHFISSKLKKSIEDFAAALLDFCDQQVFPFDAKPSIVLDFQKRQPFSGAYVQADKHVEPLKSIFSKGYFSLQIWVRNLIAIDSGVIFDIEDLFPIEEGFKVNVSRHDIDDYLVTIHHDE